MRKTLEHTNTVAVLITFPLVSVGINSAVVNSSLAGLTWQVLVAFKAGPIRIASSALHFTGLVRRRNTFYYTT